MNSLVLYRLYSKHTHDCILRMTESYPRSNALKDWKLSIFNIVDKRIKFYSHNTNLLLPKPKSPFRHLKQGIQEFHRKHVLVPVDKAANNIVVVSRLHYI